jgi:hypothetical protein
MLTPFMVILGGSLVHFRCAVHYESPWARGGDESLYHLLRRAELYKTDGIDSNLVLFQDGRKISVCSSTSTLHIEHKDRQALRIYVPKHESDQELCFQSMLPERLLSDLIMKSPSTTTTQVVDPHCARILASIFKSSPDILDKLLKHFGIIEIETPLDTDEDTDEDQATSEDTVSDYSSSLRNYSDIDPAHTYGDSRAARRVSTKCPGRFGLFGKSVSATPSEDDASISTLSEQQSQFSSPSEDAKTISEGELDTRDELEDYKALLDKIIEASRTTTIPHVGPFNFDGIYNALPSDEPEEEAPTTSEFPLAFGKRSLNQLKHDMKIGAAGELFVRYYLSNFRGYHANLRHIRYSKFSPSCSHPFLAVPLSVGKIGRAGFGTLLMCIRNMPIYHQSRIQTSAKKPTLFSKILMVN